MKHTKSGFRGYRSRILGTLLDTLLDIMNFFKILQVNWVFQFMFCGEKLNLSGKLIKFYPKIIGFLLDIFR